MSSISRITNNYNYNFNISENSDFFIVEGRILYSTIILKDFPFEEFWEELSLKLDEDEDWEALFLGDGETISREILEVCAFHMREVEPSDLLILKDVSLNNIKDVSRLNLPKLHTAAYLGLIPFAEEALKEGADVNEKYSEEYTPLSIAFKTRNLEMFEWLLQKGAEPLIMYELKGSGYLLDHALNYQREFIPLMIKHGLVEHEMSQNFLGYTILHSAAASGSTNLIAELVELGISVDIANKRNETPLSIAAEEGELEAAKLLISLGADINKTHINGLTILSQVIKRGNDYDAKMISLFLENHVSLAPASKFYYEPLYLAVEQKETEESLVIVRELASYGFKLPEKGVIKLLSHRKFKMLFLLTKLKAFNLSVCDENGMPLIFSILKRRNFSLARLMIENGLDTDLIDNNGMSLLHMTVCSGNVNLVRLLLKKGCNPNTKTPSSITPLHIAVQRGFSDIVEELIQAGADVNAQDYLEKIPFHLIDNSTHFPLVKLLLDAGSQPLIRPINVYARYKQGRVPLTISLQEIDTDCKMRWKEDALKRLCAHAFNIGGLTSMMERGDRIPLYITSLEGSNFDQWLFRKAHKQMIKLCEKYPNFFPEEELQSLMSALIFSEKSFSASSIDYLSRFQNGEPITLCTGFYEHAAEIVFFKDHFFLCDRGGRSIQPIEVFRFSPNKLTTKLIEKILRVKMDSQHDYLCLIDSLKITLKAEKGSLEKSIEKACPLEMQKIGNCVYASFEGAVWSLFVTQILKANSLEFFQKKISDINKRFHLWQLNIQLNYANQYFNFHLSDKSPYVPDMDLSSKIIESIYHSKIYLDHPFYSRSRQIQSKFRDLKARFSNLDNQIDSSQEWDYEKVHLEISEGRKPTYETLYREYYFKEG